MKPIACLRKSFPHLEFMQRKDDCALSPEHFYKFAQETGAKVEWNEDDKEEYVNVFTAGGGTRVYPSVKPVGKAIAVPPPGDRPR